MEISSAPRSSVARAVPASGGQSSSCHRQPQAAKNDHEGLISDRRRCENRSATSRFCSRPCEWTERGAQRAAARISVADHYDRSSELAECSRLRLRYLVFEDAATTTIGQKISKSTLENPVKLNPSRFFLAALVAVILTLAAGAWAVDTQSTIYTFESRTDGASPMSGVIADGAGNLYGTTTAGGGACTAITKKGCGTVFGLSPASGGTWTETILHAFTGGTSDGYSPQGLVFDASGNLYGITGAGGTGTVCIGGAGCGVIYELSPSSGGTWTETILYNFTGGTDGNEPWGSLVIDASGNLYGVTRAGGANLDGNIFELSPGSSGWTFTTLHSFATTGGYEPDSGVTLDAAGNLYGTTLRGGDETGTWGCSAGCGVVYRLGNSSTGWRYSQIYVFHGPGGYEPVSGVALDSAGNLYGTTFAGGTPTCCGFGVVFK